MVLVGMQRVLPRGTWGCSGMLSVLVMESAWAAVMYWGYGWSQVLFVTPQL